MRNKENILQEAEELSKDFKNPDKTVRKLDNLVLEVLLDIRELLTKKNDDSEDYLQFPCGGNTSIVSNEKLLRAMMTEQNPMDLHEEKNGLESYFQEFKEKSPRPHGIELNANLIGAFSEEDESEKEVWKKEPLLIKPEVKQNNKKKK